MQKYTNGWMQRVMHISPIRSTFSASKPSNSDAYPRKDQPETNASRCLLARNVISGAVRHSNNAPTDSYDREVANRDIRNNCH